MVKPDISGMKDHKNVEGLLEAYIRLDDEWVKHSPRNFDKEKILVDEIIDAVAWIGQDDLELLRQFAKRYRTRSRKGYGIIIHALGLIHKKEAADLLVDISAELSKWQEIATLGYFLWNQQDQRAFPILLKALQLSWSLSPGVYHGFPDAWAITTSEAEVTRCLTKIDQGRAMPYVIEGLQRDVAARGLNLRLGHSSFSYQLAEIGEPAREPLLTLRKQSTDELLHEEIDWIIAELDAKKLNQK